MKFRKLQLLIIALVMFVATSSFAALSYNVNVDTASLNGTDGYLYFQYFPVNAADSIATVTSFTGGLLASAPSPDGILGGSNGTLPGSVSFNTTNSTTDYNHGIHFGNTMNFILSFSDPSSGFPTGGSSTFSLGLFQDASGSMPLLGGTLFTIDLMNDGTASHTILANEATVNPVPIPGAVWLLGSGLAGLVGLRKKTRKQ